MELSRRQFVGYSSMVMAASCAGCSERAMGKYMDENSARSEDENKSNSDEEQPKASSRDELIAMLPEYEREPANESEYRNRATEIKEAIWDGLYGHEWLVSAGISSGDSEEWWIVVSSQDVSKASKYLPEKWESVSIRIKEGGESTLN